MFYDLKDSVMGDYVGDWVNAEGKKGQLRGQIRSLGGGTYDGFILLLRGRNPVAALKVHSTITQGGNAGIAMVGTARTTVLSSRRSTVAAATPRRLDPPLAR